jgi:membrane protease YdiL (CAAX protease family)
VNARLDPEEFFRRVMLVARGLGFVFLVYFIPAFLRDVLGLAWPGGGFIGAMRGDPEGPWMPLLATALTFALSVIFVLLYSRVGEGALSPRPLLSGAGRVTREWGGGFLLGAGCATCAILPALLSGDLVIAALRAPDAFDFPAFAVMALLLFAEAAREELGFRGPSQRDLAHAVTPLPAAIFLAGTFALIHRANPAMTSAGLWGVFLAGFALAGVVRARGDVAMACGLHAGWNVAMGLLWSAPVSGHRLAAAPFTTTSRDSWLSGGSFGPEASVPGLVVLGVLAAVAWTRRAPR